MSTTAETRVFNLPDVGEGLVEARVQDILVAEGDVVARFDVVAEVETDKAVVELSAPWSGTIQKIHAVKNEYVQVGEPILEILVGGGAG